MPRSGVAVIISATHRDSHASTHDRHVMANCKHGMEDATELNDEVGMYDPKQTVPASRAISDKDMVTDSRS